MYLQIKVKETITKHIEIIYLKLKTTLFKKIRYPKSQFHFDIFLILQTT